MSTNALGCTAAEMAAYIEGTDTAQARIAELEAENARLRVSADTLVRLLNQANTEHGWSYVLTPEGELRAKAPPGFVAEPHDMRRAQASTLSE